MQQITKMVYKHLIHLPPISNSPHHKDPLGTYPLQPSTQANHRACKLSWVYCDFNRKPSESCNKAHVM